MVRTREEVTSTKNDLRFAHVVALVVISGVVLMISVRNPGWTLYDRFTIGELMHAEAEMPFMRRALVPLTGRLIMAAIPQHLDEQFDQAMARRFEDRLNRTVVEDSAMTEFAVLYLIQFGVLIGIGLAVRALSAALYRASGRFHDGVSLLAVAALPTLFLRMVAVYDFPTVLFFTLGPLMLLKRRWWGYMVVFALACVNKETAVLLAVLFVLYVLRGRLLERRAGLMLLGGQLAIFAAIFAVLSLVFRGNPGTPLEFHLTDNFTFLRPFPLSWFIAWGVIAALTFHEWRRKPILLRQSLALLIILVATTLFFGILNELRDYFEVYPAVVLLMGWSVARLMGWRIELSQVCFKDRARFLQSYEEADGQT